MKLRQQKHTESFNQDKFCLFPSSDNTELTVENHIVLEVAFKAINDVERQIVVLHAISGLKFREISKLLNIPLATVLSKYHRAIKKMQAALGGETNE